MEASERFLDFLLEDGQAVDIELSCRDRVGYLGGSLIPILLGFLFNVAFEVVNVVAIYEQDKLVLSSSQLGLQLHVEIGYDQRDLRSFLKLLPFDIAHHIAVFVALVDAEHAILPVPLHAYVDELFGLLVVQTEAGRVEWVPKIVSGRTALELGRLVRLWLTGHLLVRLLVDEQVTARIVTAHVVLQSLQLFLVIFI